LRKQHGRDEEERHGGDEGSADAKASKEDVKKTRGRKRAEGRREIERAGLKPRRLKGGRESGKARAQEERVVTEERSLSQCIQIDARVKERERERGGV
jgi:hypothetical protein